MNLLNNMANQLAAEIQQLVAQSSLPYLEARLHITYELSEQAHKAHLSLYTHEYMGTADNIFRGDAPDDVVNLAVSQYKGENKQFIAALTDALSPDFCYLSEQFHLDFNREGARDVSDRFDFKDLLAVLATLATAPAVTVKKAGAPQATLATRTAQLEALLQAYRDGLDADEDRTIYFVCDIDEDNSSAEQEVYVYTNHCVCDAHYDVLADIDEEVFYACAPNKFVGDVETNIFEVEVDELLNERGIAVAPYKQNI